MLVKNQGIGTMNHSAPLGNGAKPVRRKRMGKLNSNKEPYSDGGRWQLEEQVLLLELLRNKIHPKVAKKIFQSLGYNRNKAALYRAMLQIKNYDYRGPKRTVLLEERLQQLGFNTALEVMDQKLDLTFWPRVVKVLEELGIKLPKVHVTEKKPKIQCTFDFLSDISKLAEKHKQASFEFNGLVFDLEKGTIHSK